MKPGYLSVQTHDGHLGWSRLVVSSHQPDPAPTAGSPSHIRYIAWFSDSETAFMHAHESLRRRLIDPDTHLYKIPLEHAIAAIESIDLRHKVTYQDPTLGEQSRAAIADLIAANKLRKQRTDRFFETMGYIGIAILLFNLFFLSLS